MRDERERERDERERERTRTMMPKICGIKLKAKAHRLFLARSANIVENIAIKQERLAPNLRRRKKPCLFCSLGEWERDEGERAKLRDNGREIEKERERERERERKERERDR